MAPVLQSKGTNPSFLGRWRWETLSKRGTALSPPGCDTGESLPGTATGTVLGGNPGAGTGDRTVGTKFVSSEPPQCQRGNCSTATSPRKASIPLASLGKMGAGKGVKDGDTGMWLAGTPQTARGHRCQGGAGSGMGWRRREGWDSAGGEKRPSLRGSGEGSDLRGSGIAEGQAGDEGGQGDGGDEGDEGDEAPLPGAVRAPLPALRGGGLGVGGCPRRLLSPCGSPPTSGR